MIEIERSVLGCSFSIWNMSDNVIDRTVLLSMKIDGLIKWRCPKSVNASVKSVKFQWFYLLVSEYQMMGTEIRGQGHRILNGRRGDTKIQNEKWRGG